jgi:hypothetical protein
MNKSFFSDPIESAIVDDVRKWSYDDSDNLKDCLAWDKDRVAILFIQEKSYQTLYSCVSQFDPKYDVVFVIDLAHENTDETFYEYVAGLNKAIAAGIFIDTDIVLTGFRLNDYDTIRVERLSTTKL